MIALGSSEDGACDLRTVVQADRKPPEARVRRLEEFLEELLQELFWESMAPQKADDPGGVQSGGMKEATRRQQHRTAREQDR